MLEIDLLLKLIESHDPLSLAAQYRLKLLENTPSTTAEEAKKSAAETTFVEPIALLCLFEPAALGKTSKIIRAATQLKSHLDEIQHQSLPSFVETYWPTLHALSKKNIGYDEFEAWFKNFKKKKNKSAKYTSALHNACRIKLDEENEEEYINFLYLELQLLAPAEGSYGEIGLTSENFFFEETQDSVDVRSRIEEIFTAYSEWISQNDYFDLALCKLANPEFEKHKSRKASGMSYTHIFWHSNTMPSINILCYLRDIAPNIIFCSPGEEPTLINIQFLLENNLQKLQNKNWLKEVHYSIVHDPKQAKIFVRKFLPFLSNLSDCYIKTFTNKITFVAQYSILTSFIKYFDHEQEEETKCVEKLIRYLTEIIKDNCISTYPNTLSDKAPNNISYQKIDYYIMYDKLLEAIDEKQRNIKRSKDSKEFIQLIRSFILSFIEKLLATSEEDTYLYNYGLYDGAMTILDDITVNDKNELMQTYALFEKIHSNVFMKANLSSNTPDAQWKAMKNTYSSFINLCTHIEHFSGFLKVVIDTYSLAKAFWEFVRLKDPNINHWLTKIYTGVWGACINSLHIALKNPKFLDDQFFTLVFAFSSNHSVRNQRWENEKIKNTAFSNFVKFFINAIHYLRDTLQKDNETIQRHIQKITALLDETIFSRPLQKIIIGKIKDAEHIFIVTSFDTKATDDILLEISDLLTSFNISLVFSETGSLNSSSTLYRTPVESGTRELLNSMQATS